MRKLILALFIFITALSCSSSRKETLFLGYNLDGYVMYLKEKYNEINISFTMQKGYISYLYSLIAKDGKDLMNNKSLSTSVKKANKIYIQIGNDDFLRCLEKNDEKYYINQEVLNTQKELFSYYYFLIIEEIRLIYEGDIILLSPYLSISNRYVQIGEIDKALNEFYEVVNEVSAYFSCSYIDVREANLFVDENNKLLENSYTYLDGLIKYGSK